MIRRLLLGGWLSAAVGAAGWRAGALTGRGALAAIVVGSAISAGASWPGVLLLGAFFVTSSALSRIARESEIGAKGSRRDERQVLANGGVAAAASLAGLLTGGRWQLPALAGALAAATADTWATEIGSTSPATPRLILSRRSARRGTSGAVTTRGLVAAAGGAAAIGLVAGATTRGAFAGGRGLLLVVVTAAGLAGSLVDSILGETLQERRHCPRCDRATEARVHRCGRATIYAGGVRGMDNDVVNLACTLVGALVVAAGLAAVDRGRNRR